MLNTVLTEIDRRIVDAGYDSFTLAQNMENIASEYENIKDKDNETKREFLKEQFGTQFTDTQYDLILAFADEVYSAGYGTGWFDGIADERERQDC